MTAITDKMKSSIGREVNWDNFLMDNLTGSWYQTVWVVVLTIVTAVYTVGQFSSLPVSTLIIVLLWLVGIVLVVMGPLVDKHTKVGTWLKINLLSSISNTLITLLLALVIVSAINGAWQWGVVNATFDAERTAPDFQPENGATWGVLSGARKLLATGLLPPENTWRVSLSLGFIIVMWALTFVSGRQSLKEKLSGVRTGVNTLWLFSPVILYIFLAGVPNDSYNLSGVLIGVVVLTALYLLFWQQRVLKFTWISLAGTAVAWPILYTIWWLIGRSEVFPPINVDLWGGFLLTIIIAASVIILSLPVGMALALGRRSEVYGIPSWIVWPVAIAATIWGFTTTPFLLETSRNNVERVLAFWPLLIVGIAYMIHKQFKGNIVAAASTAFIELVRSVPLITLLFMGIVMAPFFFKTGTSIAKPWPVIVGYAIFSSAYMAETIRGGFQAIPKGQFEAADSLGFNTLQKMRFIIMPQALRIVIPAIVGQFIGAFKSSSLVSIVGLFDFLGINRAIITNPVWMGLRIELYAFMAVVYFIGSFAMSSYSRKLEADLDAGRV
ncbi:MAG: amino acid ABC transporter permease [Chloroflexi bacterium]|nr:amino acid ABC transporter permease [Chloroflexota bacterium]